MDSFLDQLPAHEREKIRQRLRSPEEYERLREKVKGPEDLEREMERNAEFAEARLMLESEPVKQESAHESVRAFVHEQGIDGALEDAPAAAHACVERGDFRVIITEKNHEPHLAVKLQKSEKDTTALSGNVAEVLVLKPTLQQQILSSLTL